MDKAKCPEGRFSFIAVFIIGVLGMWLTSKYFLGKESADDRQERDRRIATEMNRFKR